MPREFTFEGPPQPTRPTGPVRPEGVPEGAIPFGENTWLAPIPGTDRLGVFGMKYDPNSLKPIGFGLVDDFARPDADGGVSDPFAGERLAETVRHNKEQEALSRRQLALDTATNAIDQTRQLLPFTVDPNKEFFSGFGPEGLLAGFSKEFGLPFDPVAIQHQQVSPAGIGSAVLSPEIQQMLQGIR